MGPEPISQPEKTNGSSGTLPFPRVWWGRVLYGLFVTTLPVLSFWSIPALSPLWQTGELHSYITLLLFPQASVLFFPLLGYSILSYLLLLFAPTRYAGSFFIRLGVYTGVLLALQYSIAVLLYSLHSFAYLLILIWIFPLVFSIMYRWSSVRWTIPRLNKKWLLILLGVLIVASLLTKGSLPFLVLIASVMAAPFWSLLLALQVSIWLIKNYETKFTLPRALGLITWAAAYGTALRFDILKMYELYAALPPTPPADCYISTAAARGHPHFVGAWTIRCADGKCMQINAQMQCLKCAELALMVASPHLHTLLRRMYDVVGKRLARKIQNPWLADTAYLFLKPWEWSAGLALKILIPETDLISKKIYVCQ